MCYSINVRHIDLFSGIGGFSLAVEAVCPNSEHIFCEIDPYCQALLKKRFEGSVIYGDIRTLSRERLIAETQGAGQLREEKQENDGTDSERRWGYDFANKVSDITILTGGFPCQPFSQAGKRRGTEDNRYLWPEMLRVIREFKPTWVVAENVRGLLTIEQGMVFEQVCLDLEREGYEVQPFIIPAVAVNAPHRRDRVWFVGYSNAGRGIGGNEDGTNKIGEVASSEHKGNISDATHSATKRLERETREVVQESKQRFTCNDRHTEFVNAQGMWEQQDGKESDGLCGRERQRWQQNWLEVATRFCGVDDGLPARVDRLELSKSRHRIERLKGLGNSIVPQVAIEIFKAIMSVEVKRNI